MGADDSFRSLESQKESNVHVSVLFQIIANRWLARWAPYTRDEAFSKSTELFAGAARAI
jgi:hypothetical protein